MHNFFHKKTIFILISILIFGIGISILIVGIQFYFQKDIYKVIAEKYDEGPPPTGDNVSGFAWSENIGWISFNSSDCDTDNNGYIDTDAMVNGCGGNNSTDVTNDYGVNINQNTGNFSGYAWSSNVGWISFSENEATPDSYDFNVNCHDTCDSTNNCTACYNYNDNFVYGWAKILSLGDDGWIKFSDHSGNGNTTINIETSEVDGWAWNGNDNDTGIGWISMDGVIAKVNTIPVAQNLTAPNWGPDKACKANLIHTEGTGETLRALLSWKYVDNIGDTQSAYRVIVRKGVGNGLVIDTGKCLAMGGKCRINPNCINCSFPLYETDTNFDYNTSYKWSVEVWDNHDVSSGVPTVYDVSTDTDNDDGVNTTFTTYKHKFPEPNFEWFPHNISVNEEVIFMASSTSVCYSSGSTIDPECVGYKWDWSWISGSNISADSPNPNNSYNASTTIIKFTQAGQEIGIKLDLTDSDGYSCSTSTTNDKTKQNLPSWIETK